MKIRLAVGAYKLDCVTLGLVDINNILNSG